jgi:hypothetical protein
MPSEDERLLERAADALLHADAVERGFIMPSGRGFTRYAKDLGITPRDTLARIYLHESVGWSEDELSDLAVETTTHARRRKASTE